MADCRKRDDDGDLRTLSGVFEYCIELVNSTRVENVFEMLSVKPGDRYDSSVQLPESSSKVQGSVRDVPLQGFKNIYAGKIVRKSLVNLE